MDMSDRNPLFPAGDYTPYGYLDNPWHSAVFNRSGMLRTVPPLGMGFWCRNLPFPYGDGFGNLRLLNYLSFLMPSLNVDGTVLSSEEDFARHGIERVSHYHTKNVLSYDFLYRDNRFSVRYCLGDEDMLIGQLEIQAAERGCDGTLFLKQVYGYPERTWWGCDGFNGKWVPAADAIVSKGFAYGDVFALGADRDSQERLVTADPTDMDRWVRGEGGSTGEAGSSITPKPILCGSRHPFHVEAGVTIRVNFALVRDRNETWALARCRKALEGAERYFSERFAEDREFYCGMPVLEGDWPADWRHGWIYHFETVRMTIRPPLGIYHHPWDGMQIHTPRQVLGETAIDCMMLGYADLELAKTVILGTFLDALEPHVPCSREDGSMNMISQDGEECATSPIWVLAFPTIRSIWRRSGDVEWIRALYPHLQAYIRWWLAHRADAEGWLHVQCSWEAQDASGRFNIAYDEETTPGANTSNIRLSDLQAAVADGARDVADYASILGLEADRDEWKALSERLYRQCQAMFAEGQFRDVDGRTGQPIVIPDYFDIMMLTPYAVGMATKEQAEQSRPLFQYFVDHPVHWLEWPSFLYIYTEGARKAGCQDISAFVAAWSANREYPKLDMRSLRSPMVPNRLGLPDEFFYRIPGVGNEFWAIKEDNPGGCENYGWGSTLPILILRNIVGFTESEGPEGNGFSIAPSLPANLAPEGKRFVVHNLRYQDLLLSVEMLRDDVGMDCAELRVTVSGRVDRLRTVCARDSSDGNEKEIPPVEASADHRTYRVRGTVGIAILGRVDD